MKKLISVVFLLFVMQWSVAQELFDKANQYNKNQEFQKAIDTYNQFIKQEAQHSWQLYFNMGNSYYKLNKIAPAIFYYEKALLLSPDNSEVQNNLQFAKAMLVEPIAEKPKKSFDIWLHGYTKFLNYNNWARLSVVFSIFSLLFFWGYYLVNKISLKRIFFGIFTIYIILIPITIGIAWFEKKIATTDNPAIIFVDQTPIRQTPNLAAQPIRHIYEGTKVNILDKESNFYQVELPDNTKGWISQETVKIVKQDNL